MQTPNLRTNQRNILRDIANHHKQHPDKPCFLGRVTASRRSVYVKAVAALEEKEFISVTRPDDNYQAWTITLLVPVDEIISQLTDQQ
jgi:hypothetical protein